MEVMQTKVEMIQGKMEVLQDKLSHRREVEMTPAARNTATPMSE